MVKKLLKHEMNAYWRTLIPVWIILMGIAILGRIVQFFEMSNVIYDIVSGSAFVMYGLGAVVALAFPMVYSIIRYYTNFFSGEGYLTFTLPTTPGRLLLVKLMTGVMMELITGVVVLTSAMVITAGDVLVEVCKAIGYLYSRGYAEMGGHLPVMFVEALILLLLVTVYSYVFYYTCISIGQLFRKLRILAAVGVYYAFYVVTQIIATLSLVVVACVDLESWMVFFLDNPYFCIHGALWLEIFFAAVMTAAFYCITHHIISKRLNLE